MQFQTQVLKFEISQQHLVFINQKLANQLNLEKGEFAQLASSTQQLGVTIVIHNRMSDNTIGILKNTEKEMKIQAPQKLNLGTLKTSVSIKYIKQKLDGQALNKDQIQQIIYDVVHDNLDKATQAYFIAGCYLNKLSDEETAFLTKAIVANGQQLQSGKNKNIVDKHCIGGVPGNRTTMLVVPIIAAAGLKIPKTSSRSITSPAGTADTMECICNVTIEAPRLDQILKEIKGFIAWGGGVDIAAADDKLIQLRRRIGLDPEGMMLASIMAKKFAAGSKIVLIDIPLGPQAKVKDLPAAMNLKQRFENIGKLLKMQVNVIITDGSTPIGRGIGPALEAIDVMDVLANKPEAPQDLKEKSLKLSGILLEMAGKAELDQGYAMAKDILESQKALHKMQSIIQHQGKNKIQTPPGKNQKNILAPKDGIIAHINIKKISFTARQLGCPSDKGSGLYMHVKTGELVKKGQKLVTLYAEDKPKLNKTLQNLDLGIDIK